MTLACELERLDALLSTGAEVDLDTVIAWYLADALQTGDNKVILNAISTAA